MGRLQEESSYEYAAYHKGAKQEHNEPHIEPAVLVQPLHAEAGEGSGGEGESEGFRIPVAGGCPSTSDPCYKHIRHHHGSANEGACPRDTRSCGRPDGGEPWRTIEEAISIAECIKDWGDCPNYGQTPNPGSVIVSRG